MRLFVDNCLSPRHVRSLHGLLEADGHEIVHKRDRLPADTSDVAWLGRLCEEGGWCALTEDRGIATKKHEREAWLEKNIVMFFLARGWSALQLLEKHRKLSLAMESMIAVSVTARPGSGYRVRVNGTVHRV